MGLVALLLLTLLAAPPPGRSAQAQGSAERRLADLAQAGDSYRLVDTWEKRPAQILPDGLAGPPLDQTSTPDGLVWVLTAGYLEAFDPQGRKVRGFRLTQGGGWMRVDATPTGDLWVLSRHGALSVLTRYHPDGSVATQAEHRFAGSTEYSFDIAATGDGGLILTRSNTFRDLPSSLDLFDAMGTPQHRIFLTQTIVPGAPFVDPMNVDVDAEGRIHLTYLMDSCCRVPPSITATATPTRPSLKAGRATPDPGQKAAGQAGGRTLHAPEGSLAPLDPLEIQEIDPAPRSPGILLLSAEGLVLDQVAAAMLHDIVVGPAGVFVSLHHRLWEVDYGLAQLDSRPSADLERTRYIGRGLSWPEDLLADSHLALLDDGRLFLSSSSCFLNGVLSLGAKSNAYQPVGLLARFIRPRLEGPPFPIAMAGQGGLAILHGPFAVVGDRKVLSRWSNLSSIQHWTLDGQPRYELPICGAVGEADSDVAIDGSHVYHISPHLVWSRPDPLRPEWGLVDDGAYFVAAAAAQGRVAVLDARQRRLLVLAAGSGDQQTLYLSALGLDSRAVVDDIAMDGQTVLLADIGRDRVVAVDTVRRVSRDFPTHDGPRAVTTGPGGEIFVLGRGGWGLRYGPAGDLRAVWAMPKRLGVEATDIAVGEDGRVFVSFVGIAPQPDAYGRQIIQEAGVWVFEAAEADEEAPPVRPSGICLVDRDKTAAPPRLPLGETVDVVLTVTGECPRRMAPHQVVFVLDTSGSMEWDRSLDRAREALISLLAAMDPWVGEVALITFNDGASLDAPLSHDLAGMRARVAGVKALGDTRYGAAIELARLELTGPRGDPSTQRTIVVVTDGGVKDDPTEAIGAAKAAGIGFLVLAYPNNNFKPEGVEKLLRPFFGPGTNFLYEVGSGRIEQTAEQLRTWIRTPGLFESITVRDEVPANMELLPESIQPPPALRVGRTITWTLRDIPAAGGLSLSYRLRPLEAGLHPTNIQADADYRDALGNTAGFRFPVPKVEVFIPTPTPTPQPSPSASPTPRPRALFLPLLLRELPVPRRKPIDFVLVLDTSSSMAGAKLDAAKAAVWYFLDGVDLSSVRDGLPLTRVAMVGFDGTARTYLPLMNDGLRLRVGAAGLETGQGTRIDLGLAEARAILEARTETGRDGAVILLTDGRHSGAPEAPEPVAHALRLAGTQLVFVGLGQDVDAAALQRWAGDPAAVHLAPGPQDLAAIYGRLARQLSCRAGDYWGRRCGAGER